MSIFSPQAVKPKTISLPISGTTAQEKRDMLNEFGMRYIELTINNLDGTNNLTFRVEPNGTLVTIPPNSQGTLIDEIHNFLEVNGNAVTGTWEARVQLVTTEELNRLGLIT